MPTPSEEYNTVITERRDELLSAVRDEYPGLREEIVRRLYVPNPPDEELTEANKRRLKDTYNARLQELRADVKRRVQEQQQQAQEEVTAAHAAAILAAVALIPGRSEEDAPVPEEYAGGLSPDLRTRRPVEATTDEMIDRVFRSVGQDISDAIDEASAGDSSKTIAETTRDILAAVASGDLSGALEEVGQGDLVDKDSDFSVESLSQLYNNSKRILSHEAATMADETGKTLAALNPAVGFVQWELSTTHAALGSSPDVCDVLAELDVYGYGNGVWHKKTVPSLPHPHCECRQSVILKSPSEWGSSRDVPDRPSVSNDNVRGLMESMEGERTVTDSHVQRQSDTLREITALAHDSPRGL